MISRRGIHRLQSEEAKTTLSEYDSKKLLARYGIPVVQERLVSIPDEAVEAACELGMPVAVKLCAASLAHKTERGFVRLGISSGEAVRTAAQELQAAARPEDGDVGILVCSMVDGTRELIAGVATDPTFGRCVMLGVGGVLAEATADVTFRLLPITRVDALEMPADLRTQSLLGQFRGEPPINRDALASVLCGLSDLVTCESDVFSVDVNPLIVTNGQPMAVDALIEIRGAR